MKKILFLIWLLLSSSIAMRCSELPVVPGVLADPPEKVLDEIKEPDKKPTEEHGSLKNSFNHILTSISAYIPLVISVGLMSYDCYSAMTNTETGSQKNFLEWLHGSIPTLVATYSAYKISSALNFDAISELFRELNFPDGLCHYNEFEKILLTALICFGLYYAVINMSSGGKKLFSGIVKFFKINVEQLDGKVINSGLLKWCAVVVLGFLLERSGSGDAKTIAFKALIENLLKVTVKGGRRPGLPSFNMPSLAARNVLIPVSRDIVLDNDQLQAALGKE